MAILETTKIIVEVDNYKILGNAVKRLQENDKNKDLGKYLIIKLLKFCFISM